MPHTPPWNACWVDVHLATFAPETPTPYGIIENAAIAIADGRIAWLGPQSALPQAPEQLAKDVYSGNGQWITPGLIDCHTHLIYAGNRADEFALRLQGASYAQIAQAGGGIQKTVAATRAASVETLLAQSSKRLKALLAEGVTTVEIKSGYGLDLATELKMLHLARTLGEQFPVTVRTTFLGAHALPPEYHDQQQAYVDMICQTMLPAIMAENLADAMDVFCDKIAFTREQTRQLFEAARYYHLPVKIHAEQLSDQQGAALAAEYHALSADHLEYASESSIAAMATAGTIAVLLPGAFYFLSETRKPPVALLRQHGVPIAIATDCNPGSSPVTSLLLMLNMACVLFGLTPEEALLGATRHAAKALGLADTHGTLSMGKAADFVLWDIEHPIDLVYQISLNPCTQVIKQGAISSAT